MQSWHGLDTNYGAQYVSEPEPVALNSFAVHDCDLPAEDWAGIEKGVELAILSAGIRARRNVIEK